MCFSIPYKILKIKANSVIIEDGREISNIGFPTLKSGDYIRLAGGQIDEVIEKREGFEIRKLIKKLYSIKDE